MVTGQRSGAVKLCGLDSGEWDIVLASGSFNVTFKSYFTPRKSQRNFEVSSHWDNSKYPVLYPQLLRRVQILNIYFTTYLQST